MIHKTAAVGQSWHSTMADAHTRALGAATSRPDQALKAQQLQQIGLASVRQHCAQPTDYKASNADTGSYQPVTPGLLPYLIHQLIGKETSTHSRCESEQAGYFAIVGTRLTGYVIARRISGVNQLFCSPPIGLIGRAASQHTEVSRLETH